MTEPNGLDQDKGKKMPPADRQPVRLNRGHKRNR